MTEMCSELAYIRQLRQLGRLADELLDKETADRVMFAIGAELARLGVYVASESGTETVH